MKRVYEDKNENQHPAKQLKIISERENVIVQETMYEQWDVNMLDHILRRKEHLDPTHVSLLEHVQRELSPSGLLKVDYSFGKWSQLSGYCGGRIMGKGAQRAPGWVRRLCTHKYYKDLDISNCHPELFIQNCTKRGIPVPLWQDYCDHREVRLYEVNPDNRKEAKRHLLFPLFGCENLNGYLGKLAQERNDALNTLWDDPEYSVLRDCILKFPNADPKKEPKNTFLSFILCDIERIIIHSVSEFLTKSCNVRVEVNCFDGIMVRAEDVGSDVGVLLEKMNRHCKEITGYSVRFEEKSLEPRPEDLLKLRHCFNDHRQPNHHNIDRIFNRLRYYAKELEQDDSEIKLENVRSTFTKRAIQEMNNCFAYVKGTRGEVFERSISTKNEIVYTARSEGDTKSIYANKSVWIPVPGKKEGTKSKVNIKLIDLWLQSDARLEYDNLVFNPRPYDDARAAAPNEMNLFTGLAFVPTTTFDANTIKEMRDGPLKPFCDHMLDILCDGDEECYNYVMQWFAATIVTPWRKLRTCVIFRGEEGLGKGTIMAILERCLGEKYVSKPSDLDAVLSGFNADAVEGKLFIFLDEAVYGGCKKSTGKLKKLITEDYFNSEQKFKVRRTVENCASICMASNEDHVVQAGRNSRRWLALDCSNKFAGSATTESSEYFRRVRNTTNPQCLVNYLHSIMDTQWDENMVPVTKGTCNQRKESLRPAQKFMLDFLGDPAIIRPSNRRCEL